MNDCIAKLRTDKTLLEALEKSSSRKLTADELLEQRTSFVYGSLDSKNTMSKSEVKQALMEQDGSPQVDEKG